MSKKTTSFGKSVPALFRKEGVWTPQLGMYFLWFQFLAISPSYELARRFRTGQFSEADRDLLPSDFDIVLSIFDALRDVQRPSFADWWQQQGIDNFGYHGDKPTVRHIATLHRSSHARERFKKEADAYLGGKWQSEGQQTTLIVAIPANLTKSQVFKKVGQFMDQIGSEEKRLKVAEPRYKLHGKKHDEASLIKYLEVLKCRVLNPRAQLWEIGMMAGLSQTYSARIAANEAADNETIPKKKLTSDKAALKILTSRAILRGRMIAENAARGIFPSYANCPNAVKIDRKALHELVLCRDRYQRDRPS